MGIKGLPGLYKVYKKMIIDYVIRLKPVYNHKQQFDRIQISYKLQSRLTI